jgi:transposase
MRTKTKRPYLSPEERLTIYNRRISGEDRKPIAKDYMIADQTVTDIVNKFKRYGTTAALTKTGRPPKTDRHTDLNILPEWESNPTQPLRQIISTLKLNISKSAVKRRIKSRGLKGFIASKKPFINTRKRKRRVATAKELLKILDWYWKHVIRSDEKFELLGSKRQVIVYRRPGQRYKLKYLKLTMKYGGGSVMLWGCLSYYGAGSLHMINGIMDQHIYRAILEDNLRFGADLMGIGDQFVFQQDLDPKHTAPASRDYFDENNIVVLKWSLQSPDMNIIENAWD